MKNATWGAGVIAAGLLTAENVGFCHFIVDDRPMLGKPKVKLHICDYRGKCDSLACRFVEVGQAHVLYSLSVTATGVPYTSIASALTRVPPGTKGLSMHIVFIGVALLRSRLSPLVRL